MNARFYRTPLSRFASAMAVLLLARPCAASELATVSGHVQDSRGNPLDSARVFLEPGLDGTLRVTQSDERGAYRFEDVLPGLTGVFAYASGHALDGRSVRVAAADTIADLDLVLPNAGALSGVVQDESGNPVAGARITRAVVLGDSNVGIPFAKLVQYGLTEPTTDGRGRFRIDRLPKGAPAALKVAHPQYAQEGVGSVHVGDRNVSVTLKRGVLVTGRVLARGQDVPVSNASIFFRNAEPPGDTVITRSRSDGSFAVRLTPGAWVYEASGPSFRTANLQRITISGQYSAQDVVLRVAPSVTVQGTVKDAKSGEPIEGARLVLESFGTPSAIAQTGSSGAFTVNATEGESILRFAGAPGYLMPARTDIRVTATGGDSVDVPTIWLAPIPDYSLEVVDANDEPVAGAIVRVYRPYQFGWRVTDENGRVDLSFMSMPSDGTVVGLAEHPSRPEAALFAIDRDRAGDAIAQMLPLTELTGKVVNEKNIGIEGAVVESRTALENVDDPITLWRTLSGKDGRLAWPALVPHVAQLCLATSSGGQDATVAPAIGESSAFIARAGEPVTLDPITVPGGGEDRSALGRKYAWFDAKAVCGRVPGKDERDGKAALIVHAAPGEAAYIAEGLAHVRDLLGRANIVFAVVVDGTIACPETDIPILRGSAPSSATTYLLDTDGTVVLETFGLPPVMMVNAVAGGHGK